MITIKAKNDIKMLAIGTTLVKFEDGLATVPKDLIFGIESKHFEVVEDKKSKIKKEEVEEDKKGE